MVLSLMRLLLAFVALAAAVLVGWWVWRPTTVSVVTPFRGDAAEIVYASGVVEPRIWAKVTPLVRERIVEQCNCEGSKVAKGDVLARLDATEAQAALAELEARLGLAQEELRRLSVLAEKNAASQQSLDRARSEFVQLQALVAGQKARLDSYVLRAPSAGIVLRQDGEVGEIAELGTVLFWVGEPAPLIVVADVNEEDIPRVKPGQRALLRSDAFPQQGLEASVESITPKGDPVTKTYRVYFRLPSDTPLRIGMSTDVNVVTRVSEKALLVPSTAVQESSVFVVEEGMAKLRAITTGIRGISGVEVLSGLDERERIISPYPQNLADGARVSIAAAGAKP
jgi:membrane fusion protein (multidrug efflux system)